LRSFYYSKYKGSVFFLSDLGLGEGDSSLLFTPIVIQIEVGHQFLSCIPNFQNVFTCREISFKSTDDSTFLPIKNPVGEFGLLGGVPQFDKNGLTPVIFGIALSCKVAVAPMINGYKHSLINWVRNFVLVDLPRFEGMFDLSVTLIFLPEGNMD